MRKKVNLNPELLKEELKKFKMISEYNFYQEERTPEDNIDNLILGDGMELDEAEGEDTEAAAADIADELGIEDPSSDAPEGDATPEGDDIEQTGEIGDEQPVEEPVEEPVEQPVEEPVEDTSDDVEVDVTSLVQGSEEAKMAAQQATQNTEMLLQKLTDLESRISSMDAVSSKIEALEKEIVKRNPTPVEKLEMRSLSSYPYSQKLTDYWADKEGAYDVMDNKKDEYTLTQDDIDTTYSEPDIRKSFGVTPEDENDYEEEDI
jgi:hypothetical protein